MYEAALEALVRHLKTLTSLRRNTPCSIRDAETKSSGRREKPAFMRRKEEKKAHSASVLCTTDFSVRIATFRPVSEIDSKRGRIQ